MTNVYMLGRNTLTHYKKKKTKKKEKKKLCHISVTYSQSLIIN